MKNPSICKVRPLCSCTYPGKTANSTNPIASILSFAMCLRYSFGLKDEAVRLEKAVDKVLAEGFRTGDIMQPGMTKVGTTAMTDAILGALDKSA